MAITRVMLTILAELSDGSTLTYMMTYGEYMLSIADQTAGNILWDS